MLHIVEYTQKINLQKLKIPFRMTNMGQKAVSFVVPSLWNSLPELILKRHNLNTFKHNVKNSCLNWISNELLKWGSHHYYFKNLVVLYIYIYIYAYYIYIYFTFNIPFYFIALIFSSLSRRTAMKIRLFCQFCAIPAISITVHISLTISNFWFLSIFNQFFFYYYINFIILLCCFYQLSYIKE